MKALHPRVFLIHGILGSVAVVGLIMLGPGTACGFGLAGDQVQGTLILPWAPQAGNWFTIGSNGSPISSLPVNAIVGAEVEFGYYPPQGPTATWTVTADLSDNRITINERYADSNPGSIWLVELSSWTLTLGGLDWAGAPGIAAPSILSQDPHINLAGYDAHSISFNIDEVVLYPTGPYSYSRTTVVQLSPVPEPSITALLLGGAAGLLFRRPSAGRTAEGKPVTRVDG